MKNKLLIILAIILNINLAFSQVINPVTVTTSLTPPYSALLPDYSTIGSNKLIASIILNDLSEPSWDVRLKITIESNQIRISTKPNFRPTTAITLLPGTPVTVTGEELEPYLNYNNIDVAGISMSDLQQNGKLPEGYYTFCIEAYDYVSNRLLSNIGCSGAFIQLNGVPLVQTPLKGTVIMAQDPVNIQYQWQLSTPSFYGNPSDTEYQLALYKILDPNVEPQNSIANNVVEKVFESDWSPNTTLVYGIAEPPLEIGQRYSYTIQARDIQGRDIFKNDGFSEVGWFNYGYPEDGYIALTNPENERSFTIAEFKRFQWQAPDNTLENQQVFYNLKIVELQTNQDTANAIANNEAWYEHTTQPQINSFGGDVMLDKDIEEQKAYAWQVTGHTGEQQIAKSPIYQFIGPPLIEWFMAGNHKVYVTRTNNDDLNNLSGKGKVKINPDGDMFEFEFDSLQIVNSGGENVLMSGALYSELSNFDDIELTPDYEDNGNAYFHASALRLNKDELAIQGTVTWDFPHAVNSTDPPKVISELSWINYDNLKLNGKANLLASNKFDLIDPANFRLEMDTISDFFIINNKYTERFYGDVFLPENIKDLNGNRVSLHFNYIDNLYYFTNENITKSNNINLVANTELMLNPRTITVDFSETQSPQRFSGNLDWKGVYLNDFNIVYQTAVDASGQMIMNQNISQNIVLDNSDETNAWITYEGLDLKVEHDFAQNSICKFNTFESPLTQSNIVIEQSSLQEGFIKGTVLVPFLRDDEPMPYTLPLSVDGFTHGYLDNNFQNFVVDLNPDKEKLHIAINVKQAVFVENERLDLVVDMEWDAIQCFAGNIDGLSIWGDQNIGFGERNGKKALENQLTGLLEGEYTITIDSLLASKMYGDYLIGYIGTIALGEDISSGDGPARFMTGATKTVTMDLPVTSIEPIPVIKEFISEAKDYLENVEIHVTVVFAVKTPFFDGGGMLTLMQNDPDWGDAFFARIVGQVKKPASFKVDCSFLLGKNQGTTYWLVEISTKLSNSGEADKTLPKKQQVIKNLNKKKTAGIPIGPYIRLTGVSGRFYHHMKNKVAVGIDCNMDFAEIAEPGSAYNIDLTELPDISMPDIDCELFLSLLDDNQKRDLLDEMSEEEFLAILETIDIEDIQELIEYIKNHDPTLEDALNTMKIAYDIKNGDDFNYARVARLFPEIDWNDRLEEENYEGLQWVDLCDIDLHWPTIPSLCNMSEYVLNKVLGELPPPEYSVLRDLEPDIDWAVVEADYPEANWPSLREQFPDGGLCNLVMQYPNIDWGYIYLRVPELPRLPWPIDWKRFIPDIPGFDFEANFPDFELPDEINIGNGEINVEYEINPNVSYGAYLGIDIIDNPTSGIILDASGSLEMTFNNSGGLDAIGLQIEPTFVNIPGGIIDPFATGLGCMSLIPADNQFVGDFFAEAKSPLMCAHGHLHIDISNDDFNINLASKEEPVIVQQYCAFGPIRYDGFFNFNPNSIAAGFGFTFHQGLNVKIKPCDGCELGVSAEMGYYANIYAKINYQPEFYLDEAEFNAGLYASLKVSSSGSLCGDHSFTIASVALDGTLRYKHDPQNIYGNVHGSAEFLGIVDADVDFTVNVDL